ncbi:tetratricopeptide repeat protein [Mycolicibacter arupensis]|nr:tetratricopeptide repeat protein [Mycolicibacter arupensis]KAA1430365.1 tetratricopeptide repeat protein [Mycolicibacter arupensis]KKB99657.1 Mce associated membrane protein [Mycolicibacter arupensis]MCV7277889.1 tetratricopeptide repeat protein [Mycolicibacter arupensis]TXI55045.1 MAG: tetratricopeptide repeat protein [Mycolicibacter arupensis]
MAVEETTEVVLAVLRRYLVRLFRRFGYSVSVVAVFSLVAGLGWQLWQQHRVAAAESAAQDAAVHYAQVLTSIDSNKVDDDFAAVLNGATGDFKDTYTKASVQLRQLLIDNKATAQGTVVQSAVQSGSRDEVVVLLMVNQAVTNTNRPDPRVDRTRMKMTMTRVDGRWLASKVELP